MATIVDTTRENRPSRFGHAGRREESEAVRIVMIINVGGTRRWGAIEYDTTMAGVRENDECGRSGQVEV